MTKKPDYLEEALEITEKQYFIGKSRSYQAYRKHGDDLTIINASRIGKFKPETFYNHLVANTPEVTTPADQFFFIHGTALGELIAKNYWKFAVEDRKLMMNSVFRERRTNYYITTKEGNMALISGRIDILDEHEEKIIEVKTTTQKQIKLKASMYQAYMYKLSLMQENKAKYKNYTTKVLAYHINWKNPKEVSYTELKNSKAFKYYTIADEIKMKKKLNVMFETIKLFIDGKPFDEEMIKQ